MTELNLEGIWFVMWHHRERAYLSYLVNNQVIIYICWKQKISSIKHRNKVQKNIKTKKTERMENMKEIDLKDEIRSENMKTGILKLVFRKINGPLTEKKGK